MSEVTVDQALQLAIEHQKKNQLDDAEAIYKQVLAVFPDQPDALHLLAMVTYQRGQSENALPLLQRAVALVPSQPLYRLHLGFLYQALKRYDDAIAEYRTAIQQDPNFAEAHAHLGVALSLVGRFDDAVIQFQETLRISPEHAATLGNLGITYCHLQRFDEAIWTLRAAITQSPRDPDLLASLGAALYQSGQIQTAINSCKFAISIVPTHGPALLTLSLATHELGQNALALEYAQHAAALLPDVVEAQLNVGESLRRLGRLEESVTFYRNALRLKPDAAELYNNLGNALKDQGRLDEALDTFRQGIKLRPDSPAIHSNLLFAMQYHPRIDQNTIFAELKNFNDLRALPLAQLAAPHTNDPSPTRKLKVAYISPDFRSHALGFYMLPLLANHDKSNFEIFCYFDGSRQDAVTYRTRQYADHWTNIRFLTDKQVADQIRKDQIDILIDLHLHMGGGRTLVYAQKTAPVQISFAGYPGTTGLTMIDYRLTDQYLEPTNLPPVPSSEKLLRLPDTFWCYHAQNPEILPNTLPALTNNYITFASLNNFCKVNHECLALWAKVMQQLPTSKLLLLTDQGDHRKATTDFLQAQNITENRVTFIPRQNTPDYFQTYHQIDIGLDTFPYNGHTTSLDSFFMGVPVITLIGQTPISRAGLSQLTNLNLTELAANTPEQFIQIATSLANDLPRLTQLRSALRTRMNASPLTNAPLFAKNIESAYRTAWIHWCERPS